MQSVSIFFKFVHPCFLYFLLCHLYLLLPFWAVILMFHSIWSVTFLHIIMVSPGTHLANKIWVPIQNHWVPVQAQRRLKEICVVKQQPQEQPQKSQEYWGYSTKTASYATFTMNVCLVKSSKCFKTGTGVAAGAICQQNLDSVTMRF